MTQLKTTKQVREFIRSEGRGRVNWRTAEYDPMFTNKLTSKDGKELRAIKVYYTGNDDFVARLRNFAGAENVKVTNGNAYYRVKPGITVRCELA